MGIHPSKEAFTIQSPNSMMAGKSETVDYGSLLPQGLYSSACVDYDYKVVRRFIREGRLAPFYKGLNELPEPSISDHNQAPSMCVPISTKTVSTPDHCTTTTTTPTATTVTTHCPTVKKQAVRFPSRPSLRPSKSPSDLNALLYTDTVECPICFLIYPAFINYSRCCDKPICTECFLQLRRSPESPLIPAVCPFCVQPNFGVVHVPPVWSIHYENLSKRRLDLIRTVSANDTSTTSTRRKRLGPNDPDVVLVDQVRPNWQDMLDIMPPNRRRHSGSMSGSGTTRRTVVRPNAAGGNARSRPRRTYSSMVPSEYSNYMDSLNSHMDMDLEEVMVMEAIRLSLAEQALQDQQRTPPGSTEQSPVETPSRSVPQSPPVS